MAGGLDAVARDAGLTLLGQRPRIGAYLQETFRRLPFAATLAWYRLQADLQQHRLGLLWLVLQPVLTAAVYGTVFYFILDTSARPQPFVPYLLVGVFVFQFFSTSFGRGARAITGNASLIQSLGFPRILLPISTTIEQAVRMLPITVLLAVLLAVFGEPISWTWLLVIPILLVMGLFCLGVAFIAARLSVQVRDLQLVIPFINRILFYTSGVFIAYDRVFADYPAVLALIQWIPTYDFISIARAVLLHGDPAAPMVWIAAAVWTLVAFVVGTIFFWRAEVRYGLHG